MIPSKVFYMASGFYVEGAILGAFVHSPIVFLCAALAAGCYLYADYLVEKEHGDL